MRRWTRIGIGLLAAALLVALGRALGGYVEPFRRAVQGLGALGPVVFVLGYAAAVVALVPGSALTLAAGAIFGVGRATALVFVAAVLGSSAAFLIARYLARGAVERRIAGNPRFAAIDRAIGRQGRRIVFLLRLSPAIPFTLLNYALGLTGVSFADVLLASLGMLPGTLLYAYLGSVAGDAASASAGGAEVGQTAVKAVGLAATAAVTIYVTVLARRALREATGAPGQ